MDLKGYQLPINKAMPVLDLSKNENVSANEKMKDLIVQQNINELPTLKEVFTSMICNFQTSLKYKFFFQK